MGGVGGHQGINPLSSSHRWPAFFPAPLSNELVQLAAGNHTRSRCLINSYKFLFAGFTPRGTRRNKAGNVNKTKSATAELISKPSRLLLSQGCPWIFTSFSWDSARQRGETDPHAPPQPPPTPAQISNHSQGDTWSDAGPPRRPLLHRSQ